MVATGLGDDADATPRPLRRAVGAALRVLDRPAPRAPRRSTPPVGALAEGALLGAYALHRLQVRRRPSRALRTITIAAPDVVPRGRASRRAASSPRPSPRVRDLVNTPPNDLYPETFAARRRGHRRGSRASTVEVLDETALRSGGYGGILAVGAGSVRPPRLVRISYRPARPRAQVALVGKGITFDSGGLNLKTANLTWMKSDMGGARRRRSRRIAAAALKLPVAVTATVPMAENMPSGTAYRPSDVLTMRGGRTVEVADTDAEGRLILADAIARAVEDDPDYLIEASTLTGAQLVALGPRVIGAMGDAELARPGRRGRRRGRRAIWPMPLPDELRAGLDSPVADLANLPGRPVGRHARRPASSWPSSCPTGLPWVHLDIAGPGLQPGRPARLHAQGRHRRRRAHDHRRRWTRSAGAWR